MTQIQTVTGPIEHTQLGLTLSHEHLFVTSAGIRANYPWMFNPEAEMAHAIVQLNEARAAGVRTLIDCSTPDLGREPAMMRAAAEATGMQIVVATGLWLDIPRLLAPRDDPHRRHRGALRARDRGRPRGCARAARA